MKKLNCILLFFLLLFFFPKLSAQTYQPNWDSLDKRPVPQWFKDVKFGIFIHWGVYSVPGYCSKGNYAEWYQYGLATGDAARINYQKLKFNNAPYADFANQFKAELFQPDEWASLIEKSGAKYVVLTSKHHDGFALWPSKEADKSWGYPWNSVTTGPKRDLIADLFASLRKTSVKPGLYYSLFEWFNPLYLKDKNKYVTEHMWPQMKELINNYQPDVFWTDGDWDLSAETWKSQQFLAWLYNESAVRQNVVTYDRWGAGTRFHHGGVYTPEYQPDVNFEDHYWEESRGMGMSYGYNREEDAWDYNSAQSLVLQLVDKVSGGGNFLLDIGPDEHGKIPPIMQERLLDIGKWMDINGEAIYNTERWKRPSQWTEGEIGYKPKKGEDFLIKTTINPEMGYAVKDCFFTYNVEKNNLYAILPKWPNDKTFTIKDLKLNQNTKIELLETKQVLQWKQVNNDVIIAFPDFNPNQIKSQHAFVIKINNDGKFVKKPKATVNYLNGTTYPTVQIETIANAQIFYTLDGSEPTTAAIAYKLPFSVKNDANLNFAAFADGLLPSNTQSIALKTYNWQKNQVVPNLKNGISLTIYETPITVVDDLLMQKPLQTKLVINVSLSDITRKEHVGLVFDGWIKIPEDAVYNFYLSGDDGTKLWMDNQVLIPSAHVNGSDLRTAKMALKKGFHQIKLAYLQIGGDASLKLQVESPSLKKQNIPSTWWFTNPK